MTALLEQTGVAPPVSREGPLTGTGTLLRFALRRDRVLLTVWVVGLAAMVASSVAATVGLYATEESRVDASEAINSTAALVALYGKVYVPTSIGALSLIKLTAFGAAIVGIVFVFLTARHTRGEEESGRLELVAAGAVGRSAPLAAALLYALAGALALGLVTVIGLLATGMQPSGSLAFGLSWTLSALVFSAATAVAAQVTVSRRATVGMGLVAVGAAYLLRAVGDLAEGDPGWLSWLSPIGWSQQIRPFAGDRWWVAAISFLAVILLVAIAFTLRSRRDLGSGLLPDRLGPAHGRIRGVTGLAWRLQRGALVAWAAAVVVMGFVLGSVAQNVIGLLDTEEMRQFITMLGGEQALISAFLAAEISIFGIAVAGYGISALLRLRQEESSGRLDLLLATPTDRARWALSHIAVVTATTAALLLLGGAAVGLGHSLASGNGAEAVGELVGAAAAHLPAVWVMTGIVVLLFGWLPRLISAAWVLFAAFVVIGEFGALWQLPSWLLDLSPFAHSPLLPGTEVSWSSLAALTAVAALLTISGMAGWRRRDVHG